METNPPPILLRLANALFLGQLERLMGWRAGLGDGLVLLRHARDADLRNPGAWLIPGMSGAFMLLCLVFYHVVMRPDPSPGGAIFRIVVVDLVVFAFAMVSGIFTTKKWRTNSGQLEELSLSPVSPHVVSRLVQAGPLCLWAITIAGISLVEIMLPLRHLKSVGAATITQQAGGSPVVSAVLLILLTVLVNIPVVMVMAWFHFESARLALAAFATHAIPSESVLVISIRNVIVLGLVLSAMMGMGALLTMCLGGLIYGVVVEAFFGGRVAALPMDLIWLLAGVPSMVFLAALKHFCAGVYEKPFFARWLFHQWWGAGERRQPRVYPRSFHALLPYWEAWYRKAEIEEAGSEEVRLRERQRYGLMMAEAQRRQRDRVGDVDSPPPPSRPPASGDGATSGKS